jgi:uncharacterized membrane protein YtjA (UPF0391 family)
MLQGAVVAMIVAVIAGVLEYAGVGEARMLTAAGVFLLVGVILLAAFLGTISVPERFREEPHRPDGT